MNKFKVGNYVYFCDCQFEGEIIKINEDGTYDIEWDEDGCGGTMTIKENDMRLTKTPDCRVISQMNSKQFDEKANDALKEMRKEYPIMTLSDLQTIGMFCKIFKEKYLK